jgi:Phytochelatin synthase
MHNSHINKMVFPPDYDNTTDRFHDDVHLSPVVTQSESASPPSPTLQSGRERTLKKQNPTCMFALIVFMVVAFVMALSSSSSWSWLQHFVTSPSANGGGGGGSDIGDTFWDDARVDAWNQFLYQRAETSLPQQEEGQVDSNDDLDANGRNGRYLKSEAKKLAHAEKKMKKKQIKIAAKGVGSNDDDDEVGSLVYLNNTKTFRMIRHDNDKLSSTDDFFHYQNGWEAQINQAYCAVATSAAALNSLRGVIDLPQDPVYVPFPWATQLDLINNECVDNAVHDAAIVRYVGLGLGMVPGLLNCFLEPQGFVATGHPIDPTSTTVGDVRDLVKGALMEPDSRVLLNYDRGGIGQGPMGHGHWSPIGAYNAITDSFLVMDVAKYKYPPVFVPTEDLFHGASTLDSCSTMGDHPTPVDVSTHDFTKLMNDIACQPGYRGFVIIQRK